VPPGRAPEAAEKKSLPGIDRVGVGTYIPLRSNKEVARRLMA